MSTKKTQIKKEDKKDDAPRKNILKIISIIVIAIFILIIIFGAAKEYILAPSNKPTTVEMNSAESIIASDLLAKGDNINNYQVTFGQKIKTLDNVDNLTSIIQVCLSNNSKRHVYIIDVTSSQVVMQTESDFSNNKYASYYEETDPCRDRR